MDLREDFGTRIEGSLFGSAYGDALAAPNEFIRETEEIERLYGKGGLTEPPGTVFLVTDDTQMSLAVGEALVKAPRPFLETTLEPVLRRAFIDWMNSPDNTRAPGMTCMLATRRLEEGDHWPQATVSHSKGCGANMRVGPVGMLRGIDSPTRAAIAQFQAAMTHGHPTALAASDVTAYVLTELLGGCSPGELLPRLRAYVVSQRRVYHADWLRDLWQRVGAESPEAFIAHGWDECVRVIDRLEAAVRDGDREVDPCERTGDGWVAEEAFATGLLCFLLFPEEPIAALRRASVTRGDSDSIACLTGGFAGAHLGMSAWPGEWAERIEYGDRLAALAAEMRRGASTV
ncbi:MAG: ADP-ribosylglycohydrolase family protein [Capsulimonadales bacterium]|nr:ADP-ribosylglycohydrolase family protein [Capsulimonadales bacterium]